MKLLVALMLISLLFVAACENVDLNKLSEADVNKVIVCNKLYIRYASGCCLDRNNDGICDSDESTDSKVVSDNVAADSSKDESIVDVKPVQSLPQLIEAGESLTLSFVEGKPPKETTNAVNPFDIALSISNKGDSSVENLSVEVTGFYPPDFEVTSAYLKRTIKHLNPGEQTTLVFEGLDYRKVLTDNSVFPIGAEVTYDGGGKTQKVTAITQILVKNVLGVVSKVKIESIHNVMESIMEWGNPESFRLAYVTGGEEELAIELSDVLGIERVNANTITNHRKENFIVFGGACVNPIAVNMAEASEVPGCQESVRLCSAEDGSMKEGGYIFLVKNVGETWTLNLQGCSMEDTKNLVDILKNYRSNNLLKSDVWDGLEGNINWYGYGAFSFSTE